MRWFVWASLAVLVICAGCGGAPSSPTSVVKRQGQPDMVYVGEDDPEMNKAIETAGRTVQTFIDALRSPKPGQKGFAIKKQFKEGERGEHIWLTEVSYDGKLFHGTINNEPVNVKNVKLGEKASVAPSDISDWMYVENGTLVGGGTIRVLYNRESSEGKKKFQRETRMKFE